MAREQRRDDVGVGDAGLLADRVVDVGGMGRDDASALEPHALRGRNQSSRLRLVDSLIENVEKPTPARRFAGFKSVSAMSVR